MANICDALGGNLLPQPGLVQDFGIFNVVLRWTCSANRSEMVEWPDPEGGGKRDLVRDLLGEHLFSCQVPL